jgi:two-component system CitB family response regulator
VIRTLIVDDDFMVASIHAGYTERVGGFEVVGKAHTASEAADAVERLRPDLVVLDIYLPDRSGLVFLEELRRSHPELDVIMVTAAKDARSLVAALQAGAVHYIVKPFKFARYHETLESYRRYRQERDTLSAVHTVEQRDIDRLVALRGTTPREELPKQLNSPTLDRVARCLADAAEPQGAVDVAASIGISRGTARRYLEHLAHVGRAAMQIRYGSAGRPEHLYSWNR